MAKSIINCPPNEAAILEALCTLYSEKFQTSLDQCCNPYDHGGASEKIVRILENHDFSDMLKKRFRDISCS